MIHYDRIAVIGAGLIGSSLLRAIAAGGLAGKRVSMTGMKMSAGVLRTSVLPMWLPIQR